MNIITKKVRLLSAPFVGTRIRIKLDDPESLTWGISYLALADGCENALIDWGDGSRTVLAESREAVHDYQAIGEYEVRISDNIKSLRCSNASSSVFQSVYTPLINRFVTNANTLTALGKDCLHGATNLIGFNCEGSELGTIAANSFADCSSLFGRVDLPTVVALAGNAFINCPGITELHFSEANEAAISALSGYATKFGAENATISFDL